MMSIPQVHKRKGFYPFLLLAFFLLAYILPLGCRDLLAPDETRYAEIPREMLATGNWVSPHFDGLRYFEKPALGYWLHAVSIGLLGENNFAVRLPSALATGLSALFLYLFAGLTKRRGGDNEDFPIFLATLIFLSCLEIAIVGNIALLDSIFSFFVTATVMAFYVATESPAGSRREKAFLVLAGVSCGLSFLTKGFLAFAVPVLTLAPYLLWQRRYRDLFRLSWLPVLVAALVSLPWAIAIHLQEPDFWHFFFWNEHVRRFLAHDAQHKASFWLFFATSPALFLPWSFLAPAAAHGVRQLLKEPGEKRRLLQLSLCWLVFPFLLFSASSGKLLTYVLPCFPPFAILVALGLDRMRSRESKVYRIGLAALTFFLLLLLLAFTYLQFFGFRNIRPFDQQWKTVLVVAGLVCFLLLSFAACIGKKKEYNLILVGLSPLLLFLVGHFTIPDFVIRNSAPGRLLEKHRNDFQPDTVVISDSGAVGAVCWFLKKDNVALFHFAGELAYGLTYEDNTTQLLDDAELVGVINQNQGKTVIITDPRDLRSLTIPLPPPLYRDGEDGDGYVFLKY